MLAVDSSLLTGSFPIATVTLTQAANVPQGAILLRSKYLSSLTGTNTVSTLPLYMDSTEIAVASTLQKLLPNITDIAVTQTSSAAYKRNWLITYTQSAQSYKLVVGGSPHPSLNHSLSMSVNVTQLHQGGIPIQGSINVTFRSSSNDLSTVLIPPTASAKDVQTLLDTKNILILKYCQVTKIDESRGSLAYPGTALIGNGAASWTIRCDFADPAGNKIEFVDAIVKADNSTMVALNPRVNVIKTQTTYSPVSGYFQIGYGATLNAAANLNLTSTAKDVKSALSSLSSLKGMNINVSKELYTSYSASWLITFQSLAFSRGVLPISYNKGTLLSAGISLWSSNSSAMTVLYIEVLRPNNFTLKWKGASISTRHFNSTPKVAPDVLKALQALNEVLYARVEAYALDSTGAIVPLTTSINSIYKLRLLVQLLVVPITTPGSTTGTGAGLGSQEYSASVLSALSDDAYVKSFLTVEGTGTSLDVYSKSTIAKSLARSSPSAQFSVGDLGCAEIAAGVLCGSMYPT